MVVWGPNAVAALASLRVVSHRIGFAARRFRELGFTWSLPGRLVRALSVRITLSPVLCVGDSLLAIRGTCVRRAISQPTAALAGSAGKSGIRGVGTL